MMQQRQFFPDCDNLCFIGETVDEKAAIEWLEENEKRRLFFIQCNWNFMHPRISAFGATTLFEQKIAANEIGWSAVMQSLEIQAAKECFAIENRVRESHRAARLLLTMVSDYGIGAFSNARENWKKSGPFVSLSSLKNCMKRVPAIVVGAGPSLEEALPTLKEFSSRALIIGSGTALSILSRKGILPHLACAMDMRTPPEFMHAGFGSIACVQSKLNPKAMAEIRGKIILAPEEGPLPWESWWLGNEELFDCGNSVGNFSSLLAVYLGCSPIICLGMDYCYRGEIKYAEKHEQDRFELVETQNRGGKNVLTQHDWLMAASWQRAFAAEYAERSWISTAQEGLDLGEHVEILSWKEVSSILNKEASIQNRLRSAVEAASEIKIDEMKEAKWQESLKRSLSTCRASDEAHLEDEPVYQFYLAPLWRIWGSVFKRESKNEEELERHRIHFFEKVLVALSCTYINQ